MKRSNWAAASEFTDTERLALWQLRSRYRTSGDLFGQRELARLRFVRWLYQTGRFGRMDER